jgi:phosphoglycolate phosphatase
MNEHVDAVLLDFDGTLVDTAPDFIAALNRLLDEMGHDPVDFASFRQLAGEGAKRLLLRALAAGGQSLDEDAVMPFVRRLIDYYYEVQTERAQPFPAVVETLEAFRGAGVSLAVCTNKTDVSTRRLLSHFEIDHLFEAVLAGDRVTNKKPHPDHLHEALAIMGATPGRAVMVGDGAADIDAARGAGVAAVAVAYGYSPVPVETLGADRIIERFAQLPDAIRQIFGGDR